MADFLPSGYTPNPPALVKMGFAGTESGLCAEYALLDGEMHLSLTVTPEGRIQSRLTDAESGEPYVLHLVKEASGPYVAAVREAVDGVIRDVLQRGFLPRAFVMPGTLALLAYARDTYGTEPEFLWEKTPHNAILRRADTGTWYAAILTVHASKLGLDEDRMLEIVNLRMPVEEEGARIDGKSFFPAYHMNKKSWYSALLDERGDSSRLMEYLDESYRLTIAKSKRRSK